MAVKSISVNNIMVFQGDGFSLDFDRGINVLVGENGTGKTTVLKRVWSLSYPPCQSQLMRERIWKMGE